MSPSARQLPADSRTGRAGAARKRCRSAAEAALATAARYTSWTFGELPELMEVRKGGQTMVGFPALIDHGSHVEIEVFDEPDTAAAKHRAGLRRLVALQLREPLKYLEKNITGPAGDGVQPSCRWARWKTCASQIVEVALDRAFLADPLPHDAASFQIAARRGPRTAGAGGAGGGATGRRGADRVRRGVTQAA